MRDAVDNHLESCGTDRRSIGGEDTERAVCDVSTKKTNFVLIQKKIVVYLQRTIIALSTITTDRRVLSR